jgi:hypothetical protein
MTKHLLEASKCHTLEALKEYLENARQDVIQLTNEDVDVTIDSLTEKRKITPTLAAILAAKNIDSLWIVMGDEGI